MNAIPVSEGRWFNSWVIASSPPADAPMATMGKEFDGGGGLFFFGAGDFILLETDFISIVYSPESTKFSFPGSELF